MFNNARKLFRKNAGITIMLVPYNEKHVFRARINFRILFLSLAMILLFLVLALSFVLIRQFVTSEKEQVETVYSSWETKLWLYQNSIKHIKRQLNQMKSDGEDLYEQLWPENYSEVKFKLANIQERNDDSIMTGEFYTKSLSMKTVLNFLSQAEETFHSLPLGWPVNTGFISSPYGDRPSPFGDDTSVFHSGYDFANGIGTPIMATADGEVLSVAQDLGGYGTHIKLLHKNGFITLYAHASELFFDKGEQVRKGDMIAKVGITGSSTGPHVHYEIRVQQRPPAENIEITINPQPFINENL